MEDPRNWERVQKTFKTKQMTARTLTTETHPLLIHGITETQN